MKHLKTFLLIFSVIFNCKATTCTNADCEAAAVESIQALNAKQLVEVNKLSEANWNHDTNITDENAQKKKLASKVYADFIKKSAMEFLKFDTKNFKNATLKRMIKKITNIGDAILEPSDFSLLKDAVNRMQTNYAKAKVPCFEDATVFCSLEPEITNVFEKSKNPDELKYYWKEWYDRTGKPSEDDFFTYVGLRNKASKLNHFENGAHTWLDVYEDPTFEQQVEHILKQMDPLFKQLHGYVRHKLHEFYGADHVDLKKPIPMHLLGNMWAQSWGTLEDIVLPYQSSKVDVTEELIKQGYKPLDMFKMAETFFTSINMSKLPDSFWAKSIIEKPSDGRDIVCHASAWDFAIEKDVRIKQCTRVSMESFVTIHHELGHIEYYLQYRKQPFIFRSGANPGFHEAIGDVLALSVATNKHLQRIGLLHDTTSDHETSINQILRTALSKIAFLPFAYAMDKFRYEMFRGNVKREEANCYFWKLRETYGGVEPPVVRTNRDFDITAKYHASADVEYLRYFVSFIIQFQFHKSACTKAGEFVAGDADKTLNNCDIYESVEAGNALKSMLAMGSSKPWPDAMEAMTGQRKLDASAFLEYFKPLEDWLIKTNKELGVHIGWEASDKIDCST